MDKLCPSLPSTPRTLAGIAIGSSAVRRGTARSSPAALVAAVAVRRRVSLVLPRVDPGVLGTLGTVVPAVHLGASSLAFGELMDESRQLLLQDFDTVLDYVVGC